MGLAMVRRLGIPFFELLLLVVILLGLLCGWLLALLARAVD